MKNNLTMSKEWKTATKGDVVESNAILGGKIGLRLSADIHPGAGRQAHFFYSTNRGVFHEIGKPLVLNEGWLFFMGYRSAIFNYATGALGGEVVASHFGILNLNNAWSRTSWGQQEPAGYNNVRDKYLCSAANRQLKRLDPRR